MGQSNKKILQHQIDDIPSFGDVAKIIKLNEELTSENSRLLLRLDKISNERETMLKYYDLLIKRNEDISIQLKTIKSKWWYKLMTWGW